jgi:hypothetical protein
MLQMKDIVAIHPIGSCPKRMIFKFMGGPFDGKLVVGESGKEKEARQYDSLTHHGRVGQRFHTASEYAVELLTQEHLREEKPRHFQRYVYEVVDRFDNGDVLIVLIHYVAQAIKCG